MSNKVPVVTSHAPAAIGPYSQAIKANGMLFLSGQIPLNPGTGEMVNDTIESATEQVLINLGAVLEAAGLDFADVVKTSVFMTDLDEFAAMNEVYARFFGSPPPARACVQVAALPKGCRVEIEAIALLR